MGRRAAVAAYAMAVAVYMYGVGSVGFWLPLHARDLGLSYSHVTWLAAAYFAALTPSTIAAGVVADVTGRPRGLLAASLAIAAVTAALLPFPGGFAGLAVLRIVQAIGLGMVLPLATGALTVLLGVRGGVRASAALYGVGMTAGSLAGGFCYEYGLGFAGVAYSMAAVTGVAAMLVALGPPPPRPGRPVGLRDVLRAVAGAPPGVKVMLAALLARNTMVTGAFSILSVLFARIIGLGPLETALALAVNPGVQAVLASPVTRLTRGREPLFYTLGIALTGVTLHLYRTAGGLVEALAAQALIGLSFSLMMVSGNNYIISRLPESVRYTASSLFPLAFNSGWIVGTSIAGPTMDAWGVHAWLAAAEAAEYGVAASTGALLAVLERGSWRGRAAVEGS